MQIYRIFWVLCNQKYGNMNIQHFSQLILLCISNLHVNVQWYTILFVCTVNINLACINSLLSITICLISHYMCMYNLSMQVRQGIWMLAVAKCILLLFKSKGITICIAAHVIMYIITLMSVCSGTVGFLWLTGSMQMWSSEAWWDKLFFLHSAVHLTKRERKRERQKERYVLET